MKNTINTLNNNATATETTAKITTEEALEIIAENYIKLDHFEQDYYRFIERVNEEISDRQLREEFLLIDPHGFCDDIIGEVWHNLVFHYYDEDCTTPELCVEIHSIHHLAFPESYFDDDEEEFEFSVETLNGIADWRDGGLDNIIANTLYDLNEKLDNYLNHREEAVEKHKELIAYADQCSDECNEIASVVNAIDPSALPEVEISLWGTSSYIFSVNVDPKDGNTYIYTHITDPDLIADVYDRWVSDSDDLYHQFDDAMNDVRLAFAKVCADNIVRSTLGFRENDVLDNLDKAEVVMNTTDHLVVRFAHIDGEHTFEYDFVTNKVVG